MRGAAKFILSIACAPFLVRAQAPSTAVRTERAVPAARADEGGRAGSAADSIPRSVSAAEALGTVLPHPMADFSFPAAATSGAISGSSARTCVDAADNVVRSGDVIGAGFAYYDAAWPGGYGKIGWQTPNTTPGTAPQLTVRATRLDSGAVTRVFEFPVTETRYNNSVLFYASGVHVPTSGRWMLVATAGSSWGCFLLTVH